MAETARSQAESHPRPRPRPDDLSRPYWEAAAHHRLQVMRCDDCGRYRHPPTAECEACGSGRAGWQELGGEGTIWSFIVDRRNLVPGFSGPYVVALVTPVETGDDVRLVTNIVGTPAEDVHVGMAVRVDWEDIGDGVTLPQFRANDPDT
jgi:uncharacterized OB-fold protein